MHAVVGPILLKEGCYAFDLWTPKEGLSRGYAYRRVEDAHYARNIEIRSHKRGRSGAAVVCSTLEEFSLAVAEREATFRVLVANLGPAYSLSGTPTSSSSSHTLAFASEGARQSPRGDKEPPDEIFGPLGNADRLNWLSWKKR
jgi:hypothetical protein